MQLNEVFNLIEKGLADSNKQLGFRKTAQDDASLTFSGDKGSYRLVHDADSDILAFECAYDTENEKPEYSTISRSLLDLNRVDEREIRSLCNEVLDEVDRLFQVKKPVNLDKVKMPKAVSRSKAKNGQISYDIDSLANRFGAMYPEFKDVIKSNVVQYGEFLPETFFLEHGNAKVLDIIKNGSEADQKKLFKMLGEIFEDGTNEVQDVIGVTILGAMQNDPQMMAVADKYMTEYMAGPVHEINKITGKNNRYTKKLNHPPVYKPKKRKKFSLTNALSDAQRGQ